MVFKNKDWNNTQEIVVYSNYHPYWIDKEAGIRNRQFDVFSGKILDLKQGKEEAIDFFYKILDTEINSGVTICVVQSSDADKLNSGIAILAERLACNDRINKVYYLKRTRSIPKLAYGGRRDKSIHYETIRTVSDIDITGNIVLLMDDVTTTGNSLYACRDILLDNGAEHVEMFALGRTVRPD